MKKIYIAIFTILIMSGFVSGTKAAVLTFDDTQSLSNYGGLQWSNFNLYDKIGDSKEIFNGGSIVQETLYRQDPIYSQRPVYEKRTEWYTVLIPGVGYTQRSRDYYEIVGYETYVASYTEVPYIADVWKSAPASIQGALFDFNAVDISRSTNSSLPTNASYSFNLNAKGYLGNELKYERNMNITNFTDNTSIFYWLNIDKLEFSTDNGASLSLDNFRYYMVENPDPMPTPVPEPSSILLGLMSIAGAIGLRKKY